MRVLCISVEVDGPLPANVAELLRPVWNVNAEESAGAIAPEGQSEVFRGFNVPVCRPAISKERRDEVRRCLDKFRNEQARGGEKSLVARSGERRAASHRTEAPPQDENLNIANLRRSVRERLKQPATKGKKKLKRSVGRVQLSPRIPS